MCVLPQGRGLLGLKGGLGFLKLYWLSVYFSAAVIRCHGQDQLTEEKVVYVGLWFQGVGVHHDQGRAASRGRHGGRSRKLRA